MNEAQVRTLEQVREVLAGTQALELRPIADEPGRYAWIERVLKRLLEIGKLTSNVDRLIADTESQAQKLNSLLHQSTFIKGAIAAGVVLVGVFIWVAATFLSSKWDAVIEVFRSLSKQ